MKMVTFLLFLSIVCSIYIYSIFTFMLIESGALIS